MIHQVLVHTSISSSGKQDMFAQPWTMRATCTKAFFMANEFKDDSIDGSTSVAEDWDNWLNISDA